MVLISKTSQMFVTLPRLLSLKWPCVKKVGTFVLCFFLIFALGTLLPNVRNVILYPVWPNAWRPISTMEIMSIKVFTQTKMAISPEITKCKNRQMNPRLNSSEKPNMFFYPELRKITLKEPKHAGFLPTLNDQEKRESVDLLIVAAEAFQKAGIDYFLVEGSLLGAHRHRGMIPWDDDIDIAVNVSLWSKVSDALGCIEGYALNIRPEMHWKFVQNSTKSSSGFPFLDIFFYTENEERLWAVTDYLAQTVIFSKSDVFPLTTAPFEGLSVSVPARTDHILRTLFDYEMCQASNTNHKMYNSSVKRQTTIVQCSSLSYMYEMFHLLN